VTSGDVVEITHEGAKKTGRIPVGGIMYDDSGTVVSEVVLKDRIHMATEGIFVVVLTVARGSGRLMTSPDIISRGFIYLRDSEELMGTVRQYLKQKVARSFSGKHIDLDVIKKELKDEITHILYDQTRRTPIVIPVINEVGGGGGQGGGQHRDRDNQAPRPAKEASTHSYRIDEQPVIESLETKTFPAPQMPDTDAVDPKVRTETRGY